jgi:hypothetical protein
LPRSITALIFSGAGFEAEDAEIFDEALVLCEHCSWDNGAFFVACLVDFGFIQILVESLCFVL